MKKVLPKIKLLLSFVKEKGSIKRNINNKPSKKNVRRNSGSKLSSLSVLILMIFLFEFGFALSVYAFKSQDPITGAVVKAIPYPAIFTTAGVSTVNDYMLEKEYIIHFYDSTKQTDYSEDELSDQILAQEAENIIIKREAIAYKKSVSEAEVEESMKQIYDGNGGIEEVEKALKDLYGLSVEDFKKLVKIQLLRDKINKEVIARVTARHILIRVEDGATDEATNEAKVRIDGYLSEINNGLSFEEAANKYSEDVGSNQNGGLLESFARGDMVEEFEQEAFSIPIGQVSEPFRTSFGWHILKVEEKSGYIEQSFSDWLDGLMNKNVVLFLYKG